MRSPRPPASSNCRPPTRRGRARRRQKTVSVALVPKARIGDYVIVHVGHAIGLLDAERRSKRWPCSPSSRRPKADAPHEGIDEFRDGRMARACRTRIAAAVDPTRRYHFMEFCGGHAHDLALRHRRVAARQPAHDPRARMPGVRAHRPHRPGDCLALERGVILCTYGDVMRVPTSGIAQPDACQRHAAPIPHGLFGRRCLEAGARDAGREVVFLRHRVRDHDAAHRAGDPPGPGRGHRNFSVLCNRADAQRDHAHPRIARGAPVGQVPIDGFVGPAHIVHRDRRAPYEHFADGYRKPVVIAGFEPLDVMQASDAGAPGQRRPRRGREQFTRAVTPNNLAAQTSCNGLRTQAPVRWRGLGEVPYSA